MILTIETKSTPELEKFLQDFKNPPNMNIALVQASSYAQNDIDRIDDLIIFRQKFIFDSFFKLGILSGLAIMLFALFMQISWLLWFGLLFIVFNAALLSPWVRFAAFRLKLWIRGHKTRTVMVSNNFLIEKLFLERELSNVSK